MSFEFDYFKDYYFFNKSKVSFSAKVAASEDASSSAFKASSYSSLAFSFFYNFVTSLVFKVIFSSYFYKFADFSFSSLRSPSSKVIVSLRILISS